MKSAAAQAATHRKLVKIACSVERLKRLIVKSRGGDPEEEVEWAWGDADAARERLPAWQHVEDADVARYVNFANVFLFAGNATIKVVEREPDPKVQLVMPS